MKYLRPVVKSFTFMKCPKFLFGLPTQNLGSYLQLFLYKLLELRTINRLVVGVCKNFTLQFFTVRLFFLPCCAQMREVISWAKLRSRFAIGVREQFLYSFPGPNTISTFFVVQQLLRRIFFFTNSKATARHYQP